jgi:hypothetical protein
MEKSAFGLFQPASFPPPLSLAAAVRLGRRIARFGGAVADAQRAIQVLVDKHVAASVPRQPTQLDLKHQIL